MKFLTIFLFLCCCFQGWGQGPNYVWARNATGTNSGALSEGFAIASDAQDNVFITGYYAGPTTFGSYTLTGGMPYLTKYNPNGNVLWAKDGVGRGFNRHVNTDALGNAYVSGNVDTQTGVTFGSYTFSTPGLADLYFVKYDSFGNLKWGISTTGTGGSSKTEADGIAADASGNAYLIGDFNSTTLHIGSDSVTKTSFEQIFIAKIDTSGNVRWVRSSSGNGVLQNPLTGNCVATDNSGNVYICGEMRSTSIKFGSVTVTGAAGSNIFLAKYDSSGNVIWATSSLGGSNAFALAVDTADYSVYIAGNYTGYITFGTTTLTNAGSNSYLAKYDTAGNAIWARSINGPNTVYSIAPNKGKIYVSGKFTSTTSAPVTLDTITITQPAGSTDPMWFAGYDSTGGAFFAQALTSGGDDNNGITASSQGCIYLGGDFQPNPFILGNDTLSSAAHENAFVAKLCYTSQSLPVSHFNASQKVFCEGGGCINFFDSSSGNPTSWKWLFPGATPNFSNMQDPVNICYANSGTYPVTLIVTNGAGSDTLTVSPMIVVSSGTNPPVVTISNDTNFSSHATTYQWYRDGSPITGATDSFYVCSQGGTYSVRSTDSLGCSALSNGIYNSCLTGVNGPDASGGQWTIYPNPASQTLVIGHLLFGSEDKIEIYNVLGEKVFSPLLWRGVGGEAVDVSSFSNGVYILQLRSKHGTINKKITVIH